MVRVSRPPSSPDAGPSNRKGNHHEETADIFYEDEILWGNNPNQDYFAYFIENQRNLKGRTDDSTTLGEVLAARHVPPNSSWNQMAESIASGSVYMYGDQSQAPSALTRLPGSSLTVDLEQALDMSVKKESPLPKKPVAPIGVYPIGEIDGSTRQGDVPSVIYVGSSPHNVVRKGDTDISYGRETTATSRRACYSRRAVILLLSILILCIFSFAVIVVTVLLNERQKEASKSGEYGQPQEAIDPGGPTGGNGVSPGGSDLVIVPSTTPIPAILSTSPSVSPTKAPSIRSPVSLPRAPVPIMLSTSPSVSLAKAPTIPSVPPTKAPVPAMPSKNPSVSPTKPQMTAIPSKSPSVSPTKAPVSATPTKSPSVHPSKLPSPAPSPEAPPTDVPSISSSQFPSASQKLWPTNSPTSRPVTSLPSTLPSRSQIKAPSPSPSAFPSWAPIPAPTIDPELVSFLTALSTHDQGDALNDAFSPQFEALGWLMQDPYLAEYSDLKKMQRFVMATLFFSTEGRTWRRSDGWLSDADECTWYSSAASSCDDNGVLRELDLRDNRMAGMLPVEVSWLHLLTKLNLRENDISGILPSQLGSLTQMVFLQFTRNLLTGTLPSELASMSNLELMGLGRNNMVGTIPSEYAGLTNLNTWGMERNEFTGTIPAAFSTLTNLWRVALDHNSLTGTIPTELASLTRLEKISVNGNFVSGTIPDELCAIADRLYIVADCAAIYCPCCSECCTERDLCYQHNTR